MLEQLNYQQQNSIAHEQRKHEKYATGNRQYDSLANSLLTLFEKYIGTQYCGNYDPKRRNCTKKYRYKANVEKTITLTASSQEEIDSMETVIARLWDLPPRAWL